MKATVQAVEQILNKLHNQIHATGRWDSAEKLKAHSHRVLALAKLNYPCDEELQALALAHDIVEEGGVFWMQEFAIFNKAFVEDFALISRVRHEESYRQYIERLFRSDRAVKVKILDIRDHLDPVRIGGIPDSLVNRYRKARFFLLSGKWPTVDELHYAINAEKGLVS